MENITEATIATWVQEPDDSEGGDKVDAGKLPSDEDNEVDDKEVDGKGEIEDLDEAINGNPEA